MAMQLDPQIRAQLIKAQHNEITEYHIYSRLARRVRDKHNSEILARIANDEKEHYEVWKSYTGENVKPGRLKVFFFTFVSRVLGLTFGLKLMEKGEEAAQINYDLIAKTVSKAEEIEADEDRHERQLLDILKEERLEYVGSIVLGLNDALVELTGALAGLTFALQDATLIALAGLITGIAASFSMAGSEYLSTKSKGEASRALKSALYTGAAYIVTVFLLVLPFLLLANYFVSLAITLGIAVLIILFFNYYVSVAQDLDFKSRFFEMAGLSLGIAAFSFGVGYLIRVVLGVEV
ncbi:MAG: VIT1/CCC1 transporter family protein [Spirochaetota bacterium]